MRLPRRLGHGAKGCVPSVLAGRVWLELGAGMLSVLTWNSRAVHRQTFVSEICNLIIVSNGLMFGAGLVDSVGGRYRSVHLIYSGDDNQRCKGLHISRSQLHRGRLDGSPSADRELTRTINALTDRGAPCVLIAADVPAAAALGRIKKDLTCTIFPMPRAKHLLQFDHKDNFADYCSQISVDVPKSQRLINKNAASFDHLVAKIGLPFVLKPTNMSGGAGYRLIQSRSDFEHDVQADPGYNYTPLIVQEFIPGLDVDVSLLAVAGHVEHVAVQMPLGQGCTRFIEDAAAVLSAQRIVKRSNYTGLLHLDGRRDERDGKVKWIEANPRAWASLKAASWCGLDFIQAGIAIALGNASSQPRVLSQGTYRGMTIVMKDIARRRMSLSSLTLSQRRFLLSRFAELKYVFFERWVQ
jgi:hypothetical protein